MKFGLKKKAGLMDAVLEENKRLEDKLDDMEKKLGPLLKMCTGGFQESVNRIERLEGVSKDGVRQLKNQAQALEDTLDGLQEQQEMLAGMCRRMEEFSQGYRKEAACREETLLSLVECYAEQLKLLENGVLEAFQENEEARKAWQQQFAALEDTLKAKLRVCAIEETGAVGEKVDYSLHEILNVVPAAELELNGKVARVYSPGLLYHGKVVKKAQVAAYKGEM